VAPVDGPPGGTWTVDVPGIDSLTPIARGGSSIVYRGRQRNLERDVAVKVVHGLGAPDEALRRWRREVAAIARLSSHPNIVPVFDGGVTARGEPFIVMPLLDGGSLGSRVRSTGPLPPDRVCELGTKLASALAKTHAAGVLHRDVKPENVLMTPDGEPQLTDFGVARLLDATQTTSGSVQATIPFAAPEVLSGSPATEASDVYSLAATLFFCATGSPPFPSNPEESMIATVGRIISVPPPDLRAHGVPPALATVIAGALAKDPASRPASADDLGRQLAWARSSDAAEVAETLPIPPPPPTSAEPPHARDGDVDRDHRGIVLTAAGAVVLLVALLVVAAVARGDDGGSTSADPSTTASSSVTTSEPASSTSSAPTATTPRVTPTASSATTEPAGPSGPSGPEPGSDASTADLRRFAREYFDAIDRGDLAAAYSMLSPGFRAVQSRSSFEDFWGSFDRVDVRGAPDVDEGARTVTVRLRLDGRDEDFPLQLAPDGAGGWEVDGPRPRSE
jgi:serine/threonine protein kinase